MNVQSLEIPLVRKSAEVAEGAAGAEADRGPDLVPGHEVQPAARPPREGHTQTEPAADRDVLSAGPDGPHRDEEDVAIGLAAGGTVQSPGDVDVAFGSEGVKGVGPVVAVVDFEACGPRSGDGGEKAERGDPVGADGVEKPGGRDEGQGRRPSRPGRRSDRAGGGDAQSEGGRQIKKRIGAGPQNSAVPVARALWPSRASSTRWLRIRIPRGRALSSGLKLGLWRGAIVAWAGFFTPRKK